MWRARRGEERGHEGAPGMRTEEIAHVGELCSNRPSRGKRSVMLSWLSRQRARMERIEVEAETMIGDFGADAYFEARRREHESSSDAIAKDWDQIALAVARRVSKRV